MVLNIHENEIIFLTETKLFHFHRIFKNRQWGEGSSEPPLDLPLVDNLCKKIWLQSTDVHLQVPYLSSWYKTDGQMDVLQKFDPYLVDSFCSENVDCLLYVCCKNMHSNALQNTFTMKANTMNPDQTVLRSCLIWVYIVSNIGHQNI